MKLRFSISNLLLLTAIVGILVAWYLDHKRIADENKALNFVVSRANMIAIDGIVRIQTKATDLVRYIQTTPEPSLHDIACKALSVQQACEDRLGRLK
jgi:hypothetical protein